MSSLYLQIMDGVNKKAGGAVQVLGSSTSSFFVENVVSSGFPNLDRILSLSKGGKWGVPYGKIINVKAKPSVGKTTFLLSLVKQAQRKDGTIFFVDSEHALDLPYAEKLGCDTSTILISQPDSLEEALGIMELAVKKCAAVRKEGDTSPFLIFMDSFSGVATEAEAEGRGGGMGEHARLASEFCRKINGPLSKAKATLIVVHQTKSKIGVMFGNPDTSIGGDAFNFHGSITINLYRHKAVKNKDVIIGHYGIFKTTKNKLFPPFRDAKFRLINGKGFDSAYAIFNFLLDCKEISKKGAWYTLKKTGEKWQGEAGFRNIFSDKKNRKAIRYLLKVK